MELLWLKIYGELSLKIAEFYWLQVRNFMMEARLWMQKIYIFFYSLKVEFHSSNLLAEFFIVVSGFLEAEFRWKIKGKLWLHK